ncbi:MAG TPA: MOSC domain-containing protein [Candidatus Limnocylindrales bacterium]|nr:MOSC domain-containing protein [Candidatus Limnocylindrales bacterium]
MTDAIATGRVLQVNISPGGVPKHAVPEARVGRHGLDGDAHHHDFVHGGPHRAVALFAIEAIERVQSDGHIRVEPGAVGENLTTSGIELSLLPVGTRLAVGGEDGPLLEISAPANPCDVIKGAFQGGKSGRISILLHPTDSRMYARVLREGVVRANDTIRVLPRAAGSEAHVHHELDILEAVENDAWLAMWRAAAESGYDVRVLAHGDLAAAASPDLRGSIFNRSFGLRTVPIKRPEVERLFRATGTTGWHVAGLDDPEFAGEQAESPVGVHVGAVEDVLARGAPEVAGLAIRNVDPANVDDARRWADLFVAGFGIEGPLADAWRRFNPILVGAKGYHQQIASLSGRDIAVAASFARRRVVWLGGATVLPEARGRGVQRALIVERVWRAADNAGARRALATADAGSTSAANLDALGMHRIWTRGLYRVEPSTITT